jgi:hypothetical protein
MNLTPLLLSLLLAVITEMKCIYNHLHKTKHISRLYNVAAILQLQFLLQFNDISQAECFILLHQYFPKYTCSAQYGCFFVVLCGFQVFCLGIF